MNASSPTAPAFNLLDTPWLPVRMLGGQVTELGLLKLFEQASQIEGLIESSPPNLVASHRLWPSRTAHSTRSLGTWTDRDRARWYREGLPTDALVDYLHHWRERFWLFHPEHPFMQVAALATRKKRERKLEVAGRRLLWTARTGTPQSSTMPRYRTHGGLRLRGCSQPARIPAVHSRWIGAGISQRRQGWPVGLRLPR